MTPDIVFDKELTEEVLSAFGKTTDRNGYIYDKNTEKPVLERDGERKMTIDRLGIIAHGSEIYVDKGWPSVVEYVDAKDEE